MTSRATQTVTQTDLQENKDESVSAGAENEEAEGRVVVTDNKSKSRCRPFNWKRLSGLDNLDDDDYKFEMNRRLGAKVTALEFFYIISLNLLSLLRVVRTSLAGR